MNIKFTANLDAVKKLRKDYPVRSRQVIESIVTEAISYMEREVIERTPEGAGPYHLKESYFGKTVSFGQKVTGTLSNPAPHFESVEFGTIPHFPPIEALIPWVERILKVSGEKEARSVAYAIALKISDVGTEGAHMAQEAFEDNEYKIYQMLEHIPDEILRKLSN